MRVGEREGFFLVVRDQHRGDAELALDLADGAPELLADLGVERAEGLVEQQHLRLVRQRARHRDALLLAAGELRRQALVHAFERDQLEQFLAAARAARPPSCAARAARTRCCRPRSCGGTARSSGTRSRRRARARRHVGDVTAMQGDAAVVDAGEAGDARAAACSCRCREGPSSTKNSPSPTSMETSLTTGWS